MEKTEDLPPAVGDAVLIASATDEHYDMEPMEYVTGLNGWWTMEDGAVGGNSSRRGLFTREADRAGRVPDI